MLQVRPSQKMKDFIPAPATKSLEDLSKFELHMSYDCFVLEVWRLHMQLAFLGTDYIQGFVFLVNIYPAAGWACLTFQSCPCPNLHCS